MSELMAVGQALTMSSIDLLDLVNQSRASHGEPYENFVESAKGRAPDKRGVAC